MTRGGTVARTRAYCQVPSFEPVPSFERYSRAGPVAPSGVRGTHHALVREGMRRFEHTEEGAVGRGRTMYVPGNGPSRLASATEVPQCEPSRLPPTPGHGCSALNRRSNQSTTIQARRIIGMTRT